jgi:flagellar assembly factor FliW
MNRCTTKYHGQIEHRDAMVITMPRGLFGFEGETRFLPIENPATRPIVFLQSLATPDLCFLALPVFVVDSQYRLTLSGDDLRCIDLPSGRQPVIGTHVLCLALVTVQANGPTTANLLAPVTINLRNLKGVQGISLDSGYSHQHVFLAAAEPEPVCS